MMPDNLFPFEFLVPGTPLSLQASGRNRAIWIDAVRTAAIDRRDTIMPMAFLDERPLAATLFYFPVERMTGDIDNIVKPILDALCSVAYPDDRLIERVAVQKFEPDVTWAFETPSEQLAVALDRGPPLLYVRIDDDLEWRTVP